MRRRLALVCALAAATLALGGGVAFGTVSARAADPGVTPAAIELGGTAPLTGPSSSLAAIARGTWAYFEYVNANGGVLGRKLVYRIVDDGADPARSAIAAQQLVEQDKVLAIVGSIGTGPSLAQRTYLNDARVPQLFVASGAAALARDHARFPLTIGFQPTYRAEGRVYGTYLARTAPGARIGVLVQDDEDGRALLAGLKQGIQRSDARIVSTQTVSPGAADVQAQVARLRASGADTLAVFAGPVAAAEGLGLARRSGWRPASVIDSSLSSGQGSMRLASERGAGALLEGAISIAFVKSPVDPRWRADEPMRLYARIMSRYLPGASAADPLYVQGMAVGWTVVEMLKRAGKEPTRAGLVAAADALSLPGNPFLVPGIAIQTGPGDRRPVEEMLLQRWRKGAWRPFGGLWRSSTG